MSICAMFGFNKRRRKNVVIVKEEERLEIFEQLFSYKGLMYVHEPSCNSTLLFTSVCSAASFHDTESKNSITFSVAGFE